MAPHDPLFKRLLRVFFADFLRLVAPAVAERLDLSATIFLDKEFPSLGPPERSRVVDLLARIPLRGTDGKFLFVHVEVEVRARREIGDRIREYHRWIQARHAGQILSIVLVLHGGRGGIREETLAGDIAGPGLTSFRYLCFRVARCRAAEYMTKPQPLAWALAALMDPKPWSRAELKVLLLDRIAEATLSEAERLELVNCVETYLQFSPGETDELRLLGPSETRRLHAMLYRMTWADKNVLEGEGRGARRVLLGILNERFGPIPDEVRQRVENIRSVDRLTRLAQRALTAKSLKSLRLG